MNRSIARIIDANVNRSTEGLRVCEEIVRFLLDAPQLTRRLKSIRHSIHYLPHTLPRKNMLAARNARYDVGKKFFSYERRTDAADIFCANLERVKESLRVLEEFFKLNNEKKAQRFKALRFEVYDLEKKAFKKLEALRNIR